LRCIISFHYGGPVFSGVFRNFALYIWRLGFFLSAHSSSRIMGIVHPCLRTVCCHVWRYRGFAFAFRENFSHSAHVHHLPLLGVVSSLIHSVCISVASFSSSGVRFRLSSGCVAAMFLGLLRTTDLLNFALFSPPRMGKLRILMCFCIHPIRGHSIGEWGGVPQCVFLCVVLRWDLRWFFFISASVFPSSVKVQHLSEAHIRNHL